MTHLEEVRRDALPAIRIQLGSSGRRRTMQARENIDGSPDHGPAEVPLSERLSYYRRVLRRRWRVIALVPAVAVAISLALGLQAQKKYDATAKLVVNPSNQVNALLNPSSANPSTT